MNIYTVMVNKSVGGFRFVKEDRIIIENEKEITVFYPEAGKVDFEKFSLSPRYILKLREILN